MGEIRRMTCDSKLISVFIFLLNSSLSSPVGMVTRSVMSPLWTKQKQELIENSLGDASSVRVLPYAGSAG